MAEPYKGCRRNLARRICLSSHILTLDWANLFPSWTPAGHDLGSRETTDAVASTA
jgi:hypothetical protein